MGMIIVAMVSAERAALGFVSSPQPMSEQKELDLLLALSQSRVLLATAIYST